MTCFRHGGAILCGRSGRRPRRSPPSACRWPACNNNATQAGWGCRHHFFKLTPDLRNRLFLAHRAELQANGRSGRGWNGRAGYPTSQAWHVVCEEAELWAAERVAHRIVDRRQGELAL